MTDMDIRLGGVPVLDGVSEFTGAPAMKGGRRLVALVVAATFSRGVLALAPRAHAVPTPEVEYLYDITVRRQYSFANAADAISYAHGICDKVSNGASYVQVMRDVKRRAT